MIEPDYIFTDGFDKYVQSREKNHSDSDAVGFLIRGEWTGFSNSGISDCYFSTGLSAGGGSGSTPGNSLALNAQKVSVSDDENRIYKTLPGTFLRAVGGVTLTSNLAGTVGVQFNVGTDRALTLSIQTTSGRIELRRGDFDGTLIAQSAESVSAGSTNCVQWDIVLRAGATGSYKVWLNGVLTSLNATGVDTSAAATDGFDAFALLTSGATANCQGRYDHLHLYCYTLHNQAGIEPPLTNPVIETQFPVDDYLADFEIGPGIIGNGLRTAATSAAVGANFYLRPFTVESDCTLNSISLLPATTSLTAKYKGVAYADDGSGGAGVPGAPAALLSDGTEVVASTNGTILNLPLATPPALVEGDIIWLGWYGDTNISAYHDIAGTEGIRDAITYASGAPNPPTTITTLQPIFYVYGNVTTQPERWSQVNQRTPTGNSYNADTVAGSKDLFFFEPLSITPTAVHVMSLKAACLRTDAGARTVDLVTSSDGTEGVGDTSGIAPPLTLSYAASYFWTDPATGLDWEPAAVNAAAGGYEIIT